MKNYASNFNSNSDQLDPTYRSLKDNEGGWDMRESVWKKLPQTTIDKPHYVSSLAQCKSNQHLYNDKTLPYYKRPSTYCMKKPIYPSSSMQEVCSHDISSTQFNEDKHQNTLDTIFKEKRNVDYYPKTCFSGNDINYASVNNKKPSYFERKSVNYSNMTNYTYCNTDVNLHDLNIDKSREKSPSRKSVNEKENLIKNSKNNHTRHVSSYACFARPTTPTLNPKIESTQKSSIYQRPFQTSIKQLFPDPQQKTKIDTKRTQRVFDKIKQPNSAKVEKYKSSLFDIGHYNNQKKVYFSNVHQHPIEKLPLRQNKTQSKVPTSFSSEQEVQNYEVTARFNFTEQKFPYQKNESKFLMDTNTSIQNNLSTTNRKKIQLSQFIIGPCKGKGRYGKVYLAIDKETGWICALKQLSISAIKEMLPQFINQVKTQSFLDHPYTTKIYGCFVDKENIYLIMEYMTEGTLYDMIKKNGPVTEKVAATKLHQVSQALSHMHGYHVIHRDLKPQNIVISFGVCKICDFGWAVKSSRKRTTSCGTLDYLSPEMLRGTEYSSSIDLWAMGVLLFEMLVGKPPFYNVSIKQTAKRIKQCEFTLPQKLSAQSKSLIECFLRKNPGERRQMDGILKHPFFQKVEE